MSAGVLLSFTAVLMTGGKSRRMGHDKALLDWQGEPLWRRQLAKLQELNAQRIIISCRHDQGLHKADPGIEYLYDPTDEDLGPLPAIARCLTLAQTPLLVLAVDMPQMTTEFLQHGIMAKAPLHQALFYHQGHRYEPLAGLYTLEMLPLLQAALEAQLLGLQAIVAESVRRGLAEAREMTENEATLFANTNTPEEWQHTKREADSSSASLK